MLEKQTDLANCEVNALFTPEIHFRQQEVAMKWQKKWQMLANATDTSPTLWSSGPRSTAVIDRAGGLRAWRDCHSTKRVLGARLPEP